MLWRNCQGARLADDSLKQIKIPSGGFVEIPQIATHAPSLFRIIEASSSAKINVGRAESVREVSTKIGLPENVVRQIANGLANFRRLMERFGIDADALFDVITYSLEKQASPKWKEENLGQWKSAKPEVAAALSAMSLEHPLLMFRKVQELTYAHERVFIEGHLFTDLRPVFNK